MLDRPKETFGKFNIHRTGFLHIILDNREEMSYNRENAAKSRSQDVAMPISGKQANGQDLVRAMPRKHNSLFHLR